MFGRRQQLPPVRTVKVLICAACNRKAVLKRCCNSGQLGYACPVHGFVELRTVEVVK